MKRSLIATIAIFFSTTVCAQYNCESPEVKAVMIKKNMSPIWDEGMTEEEMFAKCVDRHKNSPKTENAERYKKFFCTLLAESIPEQYEMLSNSTSYAVDYNESIGQYKCEMRYVLPKEAKGNLLNVIATTEFGRGYSLGVQQTNDLDEWKRYLGIIMMQHKMTQLSLPDVRAFIIPFTVQPHNSASGFLVIPGRIREAN